MVLGGERSRAGAWELVMILRQPCSNQQEHLLLCLHLDFTGNGRGCIPQSLATLINTLAN